MRERFRESFLREREFEREREKKRERASFAQQIRFSCFPGGEREFCFEGVEREIVVCAADPFFGERERVLF